MSTDDKTPIHRDGAYITIGENESPTWKPSGNSTMAVRAITLEPSKMYQSGSADADEQADEELRPEVLHEAQEERFVIKGQGLFSGEGELRIIGPPEFNTQTLNFELLKGTPPEKIAGYLGTLGFSAPSEFYRWEWGWWLSLVCPEQTFEEIVSSIKEGTLRGLNLGVKFSDGAYMKDDELPFGLDDPNDSIYLVSEGEYVSDRVGWAKVKEAWFEVQKKAWAADPDELVTFISDAEKQEELEYEQAQLLEEQRWQAEDYKDELDQLYLTGAERLDILPLEPKEILQLKAVRMVFRHLHDLNRSLSIVSIALAVLAGIALWFLLNSYYGSG